MITKLATLTKLAIFVILGIIYASVKAMRAADMKNLNGFIHSGAPSRVRSSTMTKTAAMTAARPEAIANVS